MDVFLKKLVFLLGLLIFTGNLRAQETVTISEFMASNSRTLVDEDGDYSDWIELSNTGTETVSLAGWYLTDNSGDLKQWQFPATNLAAGNFLVVFASSKDRRIPGLPLHTNFKLSTGGEYLALVKPDGTNIAFEFSPTFPTQVPDVSYGFGVLTTNETFLATNASVRILVPGDSSAGLAWTLPGYDDSTWLDGTNGVGYGTTNVTQADYSAAVLPTAPVGYWRFSEVSGTTAANVGSGGGLNGTYNGANPGAVGPRPPQFNGFEPNNTAPTFNGVSSFVGVSSVLNNQSAFTIGGWINPATAPVSRVGLFGQNDCVEFGFISGLTLECWTPGGGSLDVGYPFAIGSWHHVMAVGNGSNIRIFVDGALIGTGGAPTVNYGSSASGFNVGGGGIFDSSGNSFNGSIDEVVVYHRALSTAEILALYNAGINPVGVSVLPFVNTDVGPIMSNINSSVYIRLPFNVANPTNVAVMTLRMRYDDGFVAYVNGIEVARVNAPGTLLYDSPATGAHGANTVDEIQIGPGALQPGPNVLAIQGLNSSRADADFLISAELIARDVAAVSTTPVYFTAPTPGTDNSAGVAIPGPAILDAAHSPNVPLDADDLHVTARVEPTFNPLASVRLRYRIMFNSEIELQMFDDGNHGDGAAADGVFGTTIPASASTNGQMIRWSFRATDNQGNVSRWPLSSNAPGVAHFLGTIVNATNVTSLLPIVHLFVDPNQQSAVDSQAGGFASVFYDGEFYDNVGMQLRGNSTAGFAKKSHRMEFNREHAFRHSGPGGRLRNTSFEADYPDPAYMRQGLSFWLCEQIGAPAPFYIPMRLQLNGQFYQLVNHNDVLGDELLSRLGYDPNGALYKAAGTIEASEFSTGNFEKRTRNWEGHGDYAALANAITDALPVGMRRTNIFDMLDLPEVINYLVAARFVQENDDVWANMSLYHDNDGDGLWRIVPFDMNLSWGVFYLDNAANDSGIQATNDAHKSFPMYGSSQALSLTSGNWNRMYDVIFQVPETRQMFLRRMRTVMDKFIEPIRTQNNTSIVEQVALSRRDLVAAEAAIDRAKWGWPPKSGQSNLDPGTDITNGVAQLLHDFFMVRRAHLDGKHSVTNTALLVGIQKTLNAGIPLSQLGNVSIQISGADLNPSSGNQAHEYLQLTNSMPIAVDISGWKLEGGLDFTFKPGTIMPSNSVMYVSPDVVAFRARPASPHGGQGLFIVGNYKGQLSARGGAVTLSDSSGRLVHGANFPANPSPAQLYLRITEIMYHPAAPPAGSTNSADDFEYIELKNIGPSALDLTGVHFTNGVDFSFSGSAVTSLAPGARVLVVKNLNAFISRYGAGLPVAGEYDGNLENKGERVELDDRVGEKILDFSYNNSWYPITDGFGFSLVIVDETAPWDTWGDKLSWRPSGQLSGAPGASDPPPTAIPLVLITEVLARTDTPPPTDQIELFNATDTPAAIGGWFLTDDFNTPKKFRIRAGTTIDPLGYIVFDESQFNPDPGVSPSFALSSLGDEVYLFSADANTNLTGYFHGFDFGASDDGVSFGRHITSVGDEHFVAQTSTSFGTNNPGPRVGPMVISEIMYHPPDVNGADNFADEFVELLNTSAGDLPLYDTLVLSNTWQIHGGIDFVLPTNIVLNSGNYLLLVNFDPQNDPATAAAFRAKYSVPGGVPLFGPYKGKLDNSGQSIEVKKPSTVLAGTVPYVLVDKVTYHDSAPWPAGADGYGLSLQRRVNSQYGNDPANWFAAPPNAGTASPAPGSGPQISQQPTNQQIVVYQDGAVSVTANGPNLHYQWRFNGTLIPDGTSATLSLPNFQLDQAGDYQVAVFNGNGSQVSSVAHLDAFFPVMLLAQPQGVTVRLPSVTSVVATNITFSVAALSSGAITYQWWLNDVKIPGATNSNYTVTSVSTNSAATYHATVSDAAITVSTDPADLAVQVSPSLVRGIPAQTQAFQGDNVTFSVSISGFPPPFTYQWKRGATTVITNIVSYSTNSSFTLFNVQPSDTSLYRVSITNSVPNITIISTTSLTVLADADHDHLPDSWETQYGFDPNDPSEGTADPDHDGMMNWQEFLAGTNPTNALSVLKIDSLAATNQSVLKFQALSNHTYTVQYTPSLTNVNWLSLSNLVSRTTNRSVTISEPKQSSGRFYRLVTPQQP